MKFLSLSIPGYGSVPAPIGVPTGGITKLKEIVRVSLSLLIIAVVILCLFFIIYSGIQWASSGGDKEALQKAKKRLTYAIIGLIVALLAIFILNFLGGLFGIDIFLLLLG